jgi:choline kinase
MLEAVILAAGCGSRLGLGKPKVLVEVCGRTLLSRHLGILAGASRVRVVTGFGAGGVASVLPPGIGLVENPGWRGTGTLGSLMAAFPVGGEDARYDLLVVHGDLLWTARMLEMALGSAGDLVIPCDSSSGGPEAMKIGTRDGRLSCLSKDLPDSSSSGESMGIFLFRGEALRLLEPTAEALFRSDPRSSVDDLVTELAGRGDIVVSTVDVRGEPWEEIDTPGDLARAERLASGGW